MKELILEMRIDVKEEIWCSKSIRLKNKHILFLITGSVAIFKVVDMIRELIREGAEVQAIISPSAEKLMSEMIFEWATGNPVYTKITGKVEHVLLAGQHSLKVDLVVVAPLTANTLGKIVQGIADTNVTLTIMTAIGNKIPILLVPGMHEPMFSNPRVQKNIDEIKTISFISWLEPRIEESKAKIPDIEIVVPWVIKLLTPQTLQNQSVLVTAGPTREYLDPVRFLSNPSSGKMGHAFALEAWYRGADVQFVIGPHHLSIFPEFTIYPVVSADEMTQKVEQVVRSDKPNYAIFSAAVADYQPIEIEQDKIKSGQDRKIILKSTIKILNLVKNLKTELNLNNLVVVGFKAEFQKSDDEIHQVSAKFLVNNLAQLMIANKVDRSNLGFEVDKTDVMVFEKSISPLHIKGSKTKVANKVWDLILRIYS